MQQVHHEKDYRHELKYAVTYSDYVSMRARLSAVMQRDPHVGADGKYHIRSIYFDNIYDKALREKIDGIGMREKFRIRWYNDDLSYIVLEKKMKIDSLCLKYEAVITKEQVRQLVAGDNIWMADHPDDLVRELYAKMSWQRLRPRVLVSYVREPYIYKAGNVRVTFDSQIRTSLFAQELFEHKIADISATDTPGDILLEVKYDAYLPEVIQDIVQLKGARKQAFSKYGACRRYG